MFRKRDPNGLLFETSNLIPDDKAKRLRNSWAEAFRNKALPLIDEDPFAPMFCDDNGRPNRPAETVIGVLILKEMFNLTDEEALEHLEYNLLWHHALRLPMEEAHLCQKTLHNFRVRLIEHDGGRLAFESVTDAIIKALGVRVTRQRLDSTHILSNFAVLTRLGLFCETIRVFLSELKKERPRLFGRVPAGLWGRYLKEDGTETAYKDARSDQARRRLAVCGRDVYRLIELFRNKKAARLKSYKLLERLFEEQCDVQPRPQQPKDDDDDASEGGVPVKVKPPEEVESDSLQTPHDPDVTYSGHKGKGYEVQVTETCHEDNPVEIITQVEVTDACESDAHATIPTIEALEERDLRPDELVADTAYGSAENAVEAERVGTEVVSPVGGSSSEGEEERDEEGELTAADFDIDAGYARPTTCPGGQEAVKEVELPDNPNRVEIVFEKEKCEACPLFHRCPARFNKREDGYVLKATLIRINLEKRRRAEASGEFNERYAIRAGVEATNSELKRKHGLGKLRIRGRPRVELAVYFKALACNFKRMLRACMAEIPAVCAEPA